MSEESELWRWLRHLLMCRTGGRCDWCGLALPGRWEAHHRKLEGQGGPTAMHNLLALHDACHQAAHRNPTAGYLYGILVLSTDDPMTRPVVRMSGRMMLLDDDGLEREVGWWPERVTFAA